MKTLEELSEIACKAVNTITDETQNTAEVICVLALMNTSLQQAIYARDIEREKSFKAVVS